MIVDLKSEKLNQYLIQQRVVLYAKSCLKAINDPNLFRKIEGVLKTKGHAQLLSLILHMHTFSLPHVFL